MLFQSAIKSCDHFKSEILSRAKPRVLFEIRGRVVGLKSKNQIRQSWKMFIKNIRVENIKKRFEPSSDDGRFPSPKTRPWSRTTLNGTGKNRISRRFRISSYRRPSPETPRGVITGYEIGGRGGGGRTRDVSTTDNWRTSNRPRDAVRSRLVLLPIRDVD